MELVTLPSSQRQAPSVPVSEAPIQRFARARDTLRFGY
jgi:hypothetical protein